MRPESSGRFLTFGLGGERYALEVERVEVVLETTPITRVPKAPPHLRGVINYRGAVIPVADLGVRFGYGPTEAGPGSSVIVPYAEVRIGKIGSIRAGNLRKAPRSPPRCAFSWLKRHRA